MQVFRPQGMAGPLLDPPDEEPPLDDGELPPDDEEPDELPDGPPSSPMLDASSRLPSSALVSSPVTPPLEPLPGLESSPPLGPPEPPEDDPLLASGAVEPFMFWAPPDEPPKPALLASIASPEAHAAAATRARDPRIRVRTFSRFPRRWARS
jgi:hypothetical protein